jgi:hypothetical protein
MLMSFTLRLFTFQDVHDPLFFQLAAVCLLRPWFCQVVGWLAGGGLGLGDLGRGCFCHLGSRALLGAGFGDLGYVARFLRRCLRCCLRLARRFLAATRSTRSRLDEGL